MFENHAAFDSADLNAIFGEEALVNISDELIANGVSIDSRQIAEGNIFTALLGEKLDGHSKVADAFQNGAVVAVVTKEWFAGNSDKHSGKSFIVVKDTLVALGDLANYHRLRFDIPIIAVGGSNGKTTTKDMIAHLLSMKFNVLKTHQNFNNRLGVPLMLLALSDEYTAAVLEIGTNEPGEIFTLAEMTAPDSGIITNIGKEHLEKLIDLDGVEMEETSLFGWLHRKHGTCFVNLDDERLAKYSNILNTKYTYSTTGEASLKAKLKFDEGLHPKITFECNNAENDMFGTTMQTIGLASGLNAVAAAAVALHYGVEPFSIAMGLESFAPDEYHGYARMIVEHIGKYTFLNDCYNANPSSMQISLKTLSLYSGKPRKIAVLGDMRELGESSKAEHFSVLEYALELCDEIFLIGDEMKFAAEKLENSKIKHFESFEELFATVQNYQQDSVILLKGSRGMKMEKLLDLVKNSLGI